MMADSDYLSDPHARIEAFVKTEGDTSGREHYTYTYARVSTFIEGHRDRHLFDRELLMARRYLKTDGGWIRLHRESAIYRDPVTREILVKWRNPYLERDVEVIDLHRDFNRKYLAADLGKSLNIECQVSGDDVYFRRQFFVSRRAEIQPSDYPLHGAATTYDLSENHDYFVKRSDLDNPALTAAPSRGSTVSVANWLPWMEMGTAPGLLIHHIRFTKLGDLSQIPNKDFVPALQSRFADALRAPETFAEEDVTTTGLGWYKSIIDRKLGRNQRRR